MDLDFEKPVAELDKRIAELEKANAPSGHFQSELAELRGRRDQLLQQIYAKLTPWQTLQVARHPDRPILQDFIKHMFSEFIELHGDRMFGDDRALIGGLATVDGERVMLLGMEKGRSVEEKVTSNFGMSNPEGYRKALRLMRLAERYQLPIVCLVDTPAAYPGREAEERGQAEAIARNLTEMSAMEVPIIVVITGEGGSGGALGIAVGDTVLMLRYAIYSVIPPEGCAAILWRDAAKAPEAAQALKITADSLLQLGIIDGIIPEPVGGAHRDPAAAIRATRESVAEQVRALRKVATRKLVDRRYEKYARMGNNL